MTNYQLEEFQTWLEEDPARKEGLPNWMDVFDRIRRNFQDRDKTLFVDYCQEQINSNSDQKKPAQVIQKWLQERFASNLRKEPKMKIERDGRISDFPYSAVRTDCSICQTKTVFGRTFFLPENKFKCLRCDREVKDESHVPDGTTLALHFFSIENSWNIAESIIIYYHIFKEYKKACQEVKNVRQSLVQREREITEAKDLEINQVKQKLTNLIQQRKTTIQQELTLLRNLLNHHD